MTGRETGQSSPTGAYLEQAIPGLKLQRPAGAVVLRDWALEICAGMRPVCELLDGDEPQGYVESLAQRRASVEDSSQTPAARLLTDMDASGAPFAEYGLSVARDYREYFAGLADEFNSHSQSLRDEAGASLQRQKELESAEQLSLEDYLARYYA